MVQLLLILLTFLNFKASFSLSNYLMVIKESKNSQVSALSQIVNYFDISPAEILNHGERTHILKFESTELKIFKMKELINHSKVLDGFHSNTSFLRAVKFLEEDLSVTLTSNDAYLETDFMQINDEITGFQSTKSNELRETFVERNPPWNLDRIDQENAVGEGDGAYHYKYLGSGVTAYIVDTGIRVNHPEFENRASLIPLNSNQEDDCNGHGTHVAGILGSKTYGVAKGVQLVGLRVIGCDGKGTVFDLIRAIGWLMENASYPYVATFSLIGKESLTLDHAFKMLAAKGDALGGFIVVAAGNQAEDACNFSPGRISAYTTINTVGATDQKDSKLKISNYGNCITMWAPGKDIVSVDGVSHSGTSQAVPHIAGIAALWKEYDRTMSSQLIRVLIQNCFHDNISFCNRTSEKIHVSYIPSSLSGYTKGASDCIGLNVPILTLLSILAFYLFC